MLYRGERWATHIPSVPSIGCSALGKHVKLIVTLLHFRPCRLSGWSLAPRYTHVCQLGDDILLPSGGWLGGPWGSDLTPQVNEGPHSSSPIIGRRLLVIQGGVGDGSCWLWE